MISTEVASAPNPWHDVLMAKRSGQKRDFMEVARGIVEQAIGEQMNGTPLENPIDTRNPNAVALGQLGGRKGGQARAKSLTPARRKRIAKEAAKARWAARPPASE